MGAATPLPMGQTVSVTVDGAVATLSLNRPDAGNAISLELAAQFRAAVDWLADADGVRVLVLASSGRLFCAGGDIREMASAVDRAAFLAELAGTLHEAVLRLRELPIPIVAAIQGPAAGAGIGLVLAADLAVASTAAKFSSAYMKIGLSPDCGLTGLLPSAVGSRRAALFTLTDVVLTAEQALEWGLVSEVCAPEELAATVRALAADLAARPGACAGQTARLIRAHDQTLAQVLDDETRTISALSASAEAAALIEGFTARPPSSPERTS